jgi:hypothetical protein
MCILPHEVKVALLEWTGACSEDSSKRVSTSLLFYCLIKRCLQNHAHCAPFRFMDLARRATSQEMV